LIKRRPVKRLLDDPVTGKGKAQVVQKPGQLEHILWVSSKGDTGRRNTVVIWMLFGSGLRINEVAQLQIKDVYYKNGELKKSFVIPGPYTKTGKPRSAYILAKHHRVAMDAWYEQRIDESAMLSDDGTFGGIRGDSPLILSKSGKVWRKLAFNDKKYKDKDGNTKTTKVCGSLENLVRKLLKGSGLQHGSSHSGRRTLATWMDRKGYDLELIQRILGHESPEMTLEYIDPCMPRIEEAYKNLWKGVKLPNFKDNNSNERN